MSELYCPHCQTRDFEADWVYNNGLYLYDIEKKVECPNCDEKFWVRTWQTTGYSCEKDEDKL